MKTLHLFYLLAVLSACSDGRKEAKKFSTKEKNAEFVDSLTIHQIFNSTKIDASTINFAASCRSYLLNDSLSYYISNQMGKFVDTTSLSMSKVSKNLDKPLIYRRLYSKSHFDRLLIELYLPSPDLEIGSINLIGEDTLIIGISGCKYSDKIKSRHSGFRICKLICRIQVPDKERKYKIFFTPAPHDSVTLLQPVSSPWASKEGWKYN